VFEQKLYGGERMKTLSMIFGMLLVVGLMISPASAVNYAVDVTGDGAGDATVNVQVGQTVNADIYVQGSGSSCCSSRA